ncbi:MAG TPA: hypothetical protein VGU01_04105, partial [Sphingomicrobium sp.]|nr:hypothetical protein [Sphingomicrobium sp.]
MTMLRRGSVLNGIVLIAAFIATGGTGATTVKPDFRHEESEIAGLRQANNEAIAARNLIGTVQILADNYAGVGGNDGIIRSKEEARAFWSKDFASVQHLNQCVRKPSKIRVGEA